MGFEINIEVKRNRKCVAVKVFRARQCWSVGRSKLKYLNVLKPRNFARQSCVQMMNLNSSWSSTMRRTFVFFSEMSQQILHGLAWNLARTYIHVPLQTTFKL